MQTGKWDSRDVFIPPYNFLVTVNFPHFPSLSFSIFVPFYPFLCFIWVHSFFPLNNDFFNCKEAGQRNLSLALALCLYAAIKWKLDSWAITFVAGHRIILHCLIDPASYCWDFSFLKIFLSWVSFSLLLLNGQTFSSVKVETPLFPSVSAHFEILCPLWCAAQKCSLMYW